MGSRKQDQSAFAAVGVFRAVDLAIVVAAVVVGGVFIVVVAVVVVVVVVVR